MTAEITVTGPSSVTDEIAAAARRAGISPEGFAEVCWLLSRGCENFARAIVPIVGASRGTVHGDLISSVRNRTLARPECFATAEEGADR